MSSSSSSKIKRPDLDRKVLIEELKGRLTNLRAATKLHLKTKSYGFAEVTSSMMAAYEYLLQNINKGLYDVLPKDKKHG